MRPRKEVLVLIIVVAIIAVAWTVHSLIDTQVSTAPDVKTGVQNNVNSNAPNETIAPAGTNGNPSDPAAPNAAGQNAPAQ
ncbi:hypothetical protein NGM99_13585 [Mesorhizobium sp. RP14(2022)]|uniref:Uncharacterized protein n=1 Tax=Mesorhizobium liriopis TaxID=2953882 RepID=A0ABT1C7R5_9HYPH|nr:hypothetical protein [Mesorhizobium liriopis]MCO6050812.1 hypothetical protein [Mesorhizobium liriopis]